MQQKKQAETSDASPSRSNSDPLKIEYCSPHDLRPRPDNAKVHPKQQIDKIARSMTRFGCINPVLISDNKEIIAGHARVEAAKLLGLTLIPTVRLADLSPADVIAYNLADNRLAELGRFDRNLVAVQLEELTNLGFEEIEVTGFSLGDIDLRLDEAAEKRDERDTPADAVPELRKRLVTRRGDLWLLGPHRLYCGDATVAEDYGKLMNGQQADIVLTDPPWNLPTRYFSGRGRHRHGNFAEAHGEKSEGEFTDFLSRALGCAKGVSKAGSILFVFMDWRHLFELLSAARRQQLPLKNLVVWAKRNAGMGTFYRSRHELVVVLKNGDAPHLNTFELGQHGRHRSNLWEYAGGNSFHAGRDKESAMHPTCKPVALLADAIRDVSRRGGIVLDPFAGSGSTLIAAEKTGRRAHLLEIDSAYCDVIVRRFEDYTGKAAQLDGGQTFDDVEAERTKDEAPDAAERPGRIG
jgi:DNA modification methylase